MNSMLWLTLVVLAVISHHNVVTSVRLQTTSRPSVGTALFRLRLPTPSPDDSIESNEIDSGSEILSMDGWTDSEKLFMEQTDNAKHEPIDRNGNRIVGGNLTFISKFPYQLQLNIDGKARCGASIISEEWCITAAHCLFNEGRKYQAFVLSLRSGATIINMGGRVHNISRVVIHPEYSATNRVLRAHDIALLKVNKPFRISFLVQPINLPLQNVTIPDGSMATVSGWGHTSFSGETSHVLQQVKIPIANRAKCAEAYQSMNVITNRMICAGQHGRDSCQGDSGGPLAYDNKLIGIVSYGRGCGDVNYPGIYTRVSQYRSFIREHTGL